MLAQRLAIQVILVYVSICATGANNARAQNLADDPRFADLQVVPWRQDAALRDIFFINQDLGWAVGDHGTILRTEDGGRSWMLVPINQICSLRSVHFVDELNGWAAGGQAVPLVNRTNAVILRTRDGGRTWTSVPGTMLPSISKLRMSSTTTGWAWGSPTQHFPSGIFVTEDGGQSWSDFHQSSPQRWRAVAAAQNGFVVITDEGQLGIYHENQFQPSEMSRTDTSICRLEFFDSQNGWAIGNREIWTTSDAGRSWRTLGMPPETRGTAHYKFETAARQGDTRWLAGSPGTYIYRQDSTTNQWSRSRTPTRGTIHKLFFVDQDHGWAVGEWGNILATGDGGMTWLEQRSGQQRVGLLAICQSADCIPFELLARFSADQGYVCAVAMGPSTSTFGDGSLRPMEACQLQGVSSLAELDLSKERDALNQLIGLIRQWQPTAIVIADSPSAIRPLSRNELANLKNAAIPQADLSGLVVAAINAAADSTSDRQWINEASLPSWQTPFVFRAQFKTSDTVWGTPAYLPSLGRNLYDQQFGSLVLVRHPTTPPQGLELTALNDRSTISPSGIFGGLDNGPLAPPRRAEQSPIGNVGQIKATNQKGSSLHQLLTQFDSSPASLKVWRQRVDRMIVELSPEIAAGWLWQLSEAYWRENQLELAAFARAALVENCGDHPLASESRIWLAAYYASEEFSWCEFAQQRSLEENRVPRSDPAVQAAGLRSSPEKVEVGGETHLIWTIDASETEENSTDPRAEIRGQIRSNVTEDFGAFRAQRRSIARSLLRSIQQRDPEIMADPMMNFADSLLRLDSEGPAGTEAALRRISTRDLQKPLRQLIEREIRLYGASKAETITELVDCNRADLHPYLDGILDDEVWRSVAQSDQIIQLAIARDPSAESPDANDAAIRPAADPSLGQTQMMLAYDDEYLYIAAICHRQSPLANPNASGDSPQRVRDQALDENDLLQIGLDIDRDGRSMYLISIDSTGSFVDQIGNDLGWNPTWYVAHASTELNWIVEAAIPLDQLGPQPTGELDSAWGIAVRRKRADGSLEHWSPLKNSGPPLPLEIGLTKPTIFPTDGVIRFR